MNNTPASSAEANSSVSSPPQPYSSPQRSDDFAKHPDPQHPTNLIPDLCRRFYNLGWVTGTGGGVSIRRDDEVYFAPSGVQKELIKPEEIFVADMASKEYTRKPPGLKPSACTPLFMSAYEIRGAGCCIHTHSQWAVLVTLIVESGAQGREKNVFAIKEIEQIKGISKSGGRGTDCTDILEGGRKAGNHGYHDRLQIPIIENTAQEQDLTATLEAAMHMFPQTCAVLVRRHGLYVWGKDVAQAKTHAESLDYLFQLAVEMHKLGLPWVSPS